MAGNTGMLCQRDMIRPTWQQLSICSHIIRIPIKDPGSFKIQGQGFGWTAPDHHNGLQTGSSLSLEPGTWPGSSLESTPGLTLIPLAGNSSPIDFWKVSRPKNSVDKYIWETLDELVFLQDFLQDFSEPFNRVM